MSNPVKKSLTTAAFAALAFAGLPALTAPVAQADICGDVGGRHVSVGGCTPGLAGDAIGGAVAGAAMAGAGDWGRYGFPQEYPYSVVPSFPGEAPCISPTGLPYYTPPGAPCFG